MISLSRVPKPLRSRPQAPTSPAWNPLSETLQQPTDALHQSADNSLSDDSKLLQSLRRHLRNFEELHELNKTPLSDSRVLDIRNEVESAMPRLYALADEKNLSSAANEASLVRGFAEKLLRRFPDINLDALRLSSTAESTPASSSGTIQMSQPSTPREPRSTLLSLENNADNEYARKVYTGGSHEVFGSQESRHELENTISSITSEQRRVLEAIHDLCSDDVTVDKDFLSYLRAPPAKYPEQL